MSVESQSPLIVDFYSVNEFLKNYAKTKREEVVLFFSLLHKAIKNLRTTKITILFPDEESSQTFVPFLKSLNVYYDFAKDYNQIQNFLTKDCIIMTSDIIFQQLFFRYENVKMYKPSKYYPRLIGKNFILKRYGFYQDDHWLNYYCAVESKRLNLKKVRSLTLGQTYKATHHIFKGCRRGIWNFYHREVYKRRLNLIRMRIKDVKFDYPDLKINEFMEYCNENSYSDLSKMFSRLETFLKKYAGTKISIRQFYDE